MHAARQPGSLPGLASRLHYERHRPEQTTLYRLVQQHAASFIAHTEASTDAELPRFIKDEFDAFLECGILAHGFLRLRCGECGHDKLLALVKDHCEDYLKAEVLPHVPDAWIDHSKTKVGYEIPMTRYFYEYQAPEAVEDIVARITALEQDISAGLAELFHKEG